MLNELNWGRHCSSTLTPKCTHVVRRNRFQISNRRQMACWKCGVPVCIRNVKVIGHFLLQNSFNICLALPHLSCHENFRKITFLFVKSTISTKTSALRQCTTCNGINSANLWSSESQCIQCSTKPTTKYIRTRCILWSLNFFTISFVWGQLTTGSPKWRHCHFNSFSN